MDEENVNQNETEETNALPPAEETSAPTPAEKRWRIFTRRNFFAAFAVIVLLVGLLGLTSYFIFRFGYLDNYIKSQFITKMDEIGITFSADTFRTTLAPLSLELKNATFNDKLTGEKLFRLDSAKIGLTITDLYAWQLSRDFRVDSTDIDGTEVWVKFDENGKSNFSNLKFVEEKENGYVNLNYTSAKFSLKNGLIHFGDVQHKIAADAKNVTLGISPEDLTVPDEQKRYKFDLNSTDSSFVYDEKPIEPISIEAQGIAYREGAEITQLKLNSPVASSTLSGNIVGWQDLKYNFKIDSSVDLMQAATLFPNGTALRGVGTFNGTVSGEGAKYKIDGAISSDALSAANVRLKGLQVNATVEGENSIYNANGKAIAEMLTFEDFKIDYPQLVGNVRGNGSDFKWIGELQAAAARTPAGTIAGLFLSDAVAEVEDKKFNATIGNLRARSYSKSGKIDIQSLQARNVRVDSNGDVTNAVAPAVRAGSLKTKAFELQGVTANNFKLKDVPARTDIQTSSLQSQSANLKDTKLKNLNARNAHVGIKGDTTTFTSDNLQAEQVDSNGVKIGGVTAQNVDVTDTSAETTVLANKLQVAKIQTDAAVLGNLNIAGVRLTIRQGVIQATTNDFNAGTVTLTNSAVPGGGKLEDVRAAKPVFVLEPSGRYRASLDLSLGGGVLGSVKLGAARSSVVVTNDQVALNDLSADVMDGKVNGNALIALNNHGQSRVDADFANVDLAKLLALQGGQIFPIAGQTTGKANLTFTGTNFRTASGTLNADFTASAGDETRGFVPINGRLDLRATNGLFNIENANLNTEKSRVDASGRFDLEGSDSNLQLALKSSDASEIERLVKVLNLSPELVDQLNSLQASFAGNLNFNGTLTGNLLNPIIDGRASLDSIILRGRNLGALTTAIAVAPDSIQLNDGKLQQPDSGNVAFNVNVPRFGANNIAVQATFTKVNTGNLLAVVPFDLPETLKDFNGETSGTVQISGLPKNISGNVNLVSTSATVAGQSFDRLEANVDIQNSVFNIKKFEALSGDGFLRANGTYDTNASVFDLNVEGKNLQIARLKNLASKDSTVAIDGTVDLTAKAKGDARDPKTFDINFNGTAQNVVLNQNALGTVSFVGNTVNQQLSANVTATLGGQQQVIAANVNFGDPNLPFRAETNFNQTELAPYIAFLSPPESVTVTGKATGRVFIEGNLYKVDANGNGSYTTSDLKGEAKFTEFGFMVNDSPFTAVNPLAIRFNMDEIIVDNAVLSGSGSNVTVSGRKALSANAVNNLSIDGKINLRVLDVLSKNTFFTGFSDASVRLTGTNADARLSGSATLANASFSTFVGTENISVNRINGRLLFTSNQAQIDSLTGYLGGGKIVASGGALLSGLQLDRFRVSVSGQNVTAPITDGFLATGNADVEVSGERVGDQYSTLISGSVVAKRAVYTKDIDLADFVSNRRAGSISEGSSSSILGVTRLNLTVEGRDALVVRNNIADLTASASLTISGDFEEPVIAGRITANDGGIIFFRNDRYEIQRGVLEFPPSTGEPFINLQAETEIQGYQIFVNLLGDLSNPDNLSANLRSNPALPQPDVVSLITTGNLANAGTGIPTLAQSGINTAAEVLTDSIINNPVRKATDKLFGLNKFELDPVISGQRLNPSARLTVGRQINRNLAVTYSTNLSEDQNQILALEYRVSNRLSFVAQYEQRSLNNVTRNKDTFSFEIPFEKKILMIKGLGTRNQGKLIRRKLNAPPHRAIRKYFQVLILLFTVCCSLLTIYSQNKYENRPLSEISISFEGADKDISAAEQFRLTVRDILGDKYSTVKIRESLQALYDTTRIVSAQVEATENNAGAVSLRFVIKRKTQAQKVIINIGNTVGDKVTEEELLLKLDLINSGMAVTDQTLRTNADLIQEYLRERGFYSAEVTYTQTPLDTPTRVNVTFQVNPNAQSKIENIAVNIKGIDNIKGLDAAKLRQNLNLKPGALFSNSKLDDDVDKIRKALLKVDYLAPNLNQPKVTFDADKNAIDVEISGDIGPKVAVDVAAGKKKVGKSTQNKIIPIKREGSLELSLIIEGERRLRNYYQEQGYFFADVTSVCSVKPEFSPEEAGDVQNETKELCASLSGADLSSKDVNVSYNVNLNRRYKLVDIRIEGTDKLTYEDVSSLLDTQKASLLGLIPGLGYGRGYTSNEILAADRDRLKSVIRELGYRNVDVSVRQGVSTNGDNLIITFVVNEGIPTRITDVAVTGNKEVPTATLENLLPELKGKNFSRAKARNGVRKLSEYYSNQGYYDAKVVYSVTETPDEPNATEDKVKVNYTVENEGKKVVIGRVLVNGNERTKSSAILKAVNVTPNDVLRSADIFSSEQNLYATDAFKRVEIKPEAAGQTPDGNRLTDVIVNVEEQKPRVITYGGGYSTDGGAFGSVDIRHNNLFGKLTQGEALVRMSRRLQIVQFSYLNPRFIREGKNRFAPLSLTASYQRDSTVTRFFRSTFDQGTFGIVQRIDEKGNPIDVLGNKTTDPTLNRLNFTAETSRTISQKTRSIFFLRYRFEDVRIFNVESLLIADLLRPDDRVRISGFTASFVRDTRENCNNKQTLLDFIQKGEVTNPCKYNATDPTRGSFLTVDYNSSVPVLGANVGFNKVQATYQTYFTFPKLNGTTLAGRAIIGAASVFSKKNRFTDPQFQELNGTLPISERFFAGGSTTLRGFEFEGAGPRVAVVPQGIFRNTKGEIVTLNPFTVPFGGNALAITNLEARVPLTGTFQVVPFYDGGNVFRRASDIFRKNSAATNSVFSRNLQSIWTNTVGLGLRVKTPFGGSAAVDYGYLLNPPQFLIPQTDGSNATYRLHQGLLHFRFAQSF